MKKLIYFGIIISILIIGNVLAESISQTNFIIKIYNNTISIVSDEYSGNNQIFNFSISPNNSTNITTYYVPHTEFNYSFLFVKNVSVDMSLVEKWTQCMNETSICKLGALSNYTQLALSMNNKDNDINNKQTQIDTLTKEKQDTQNQKWLFALVGAGLAALIIFVSQGKLGRGVKEKSIGEFNKHQAG